MQPQKSFLKSRRFQYGAVAVIFTVVFIALALTASFLVDALTERFSLKADMTPGGFYDLADETMELIGGLEQNLTLYALATEAAYENGASTSRVAEVARRFVTASGGKISIEYVDLQGNPGFIRQYTEETVADYSMLMVGENGRHKLIPSGEMYLSDSETGQEAVQVESQLTSAILYVDSSVVPKAAFLRGHNERDLGALSSYLTSANCEISEVNLVTEEIPEGLDILVLGTPEIDYNDEEIRKLDAWITESGASHTLMVFLDPGARFENLERYLEEWGIAFGTALVCEPELSLSGVPFYTMPSAAVHDVTASLNTESDLDMLVPVTRPIELIFQSQFARTTAALLTTSDSSYGKDVASGDPILSYDKAEGDAAGPFVVGALSETHSMVANVSTASNVFVFGSSQISEVVTDPRFLNSQFFDSVLTWLFPEKQSVSVRPKELISYWFEVQSGEGMVARILLCAVVPALILGFGILVSLRRRNA